MVLESFSFTISTSGHRRSRGFKEARVGGKRKKGVANCEERKNHLTENRIVRGKRGIGRPSKGGGVWVKSGEGKKRKSKVGK